MRAPRVPGTTGQAGFTLIEVILATLLLTVGVLGLASTTGFVVRSISLADLRTERAAALRSAVETVRAMPYDSVNSGLDSIGLFEIRWNSVANGRYGKTVRVITTGPGMAEGAGNGSGPIVESMVADTFVYSVLEP